MFRELLTFINNCDGVFPGSTASSGFGLCLYAAKYSGFISSLCLYLHYIIYYVSASSLLGYVTLMMPCVQNLNTDLNG